MFATIYGLMICVVAFHDSPTRVGVGAAICRSFFGKKLEIESAAVMIVVMDGKKWVKVGFARHDDSHAAHRHPSSNARRKETAHASQTGPRAGRRSNAALRDAGPGSDAVDLHERRAGTTVRETRSDAGDRCGGASFS